MVLSIPVPKLLAESAIERPRDHPHALCVDVVGTLPRCMDMITSGAVIAAVEQYAASGFYSFERP
jgi:hypothetical protein